MSDTPRTDALIYRKNTIEMQRHELLDLALALERELAEAKKDSERLLFLMDQSGEFYMRGYQYHMIGRLREYIDAAMGDGK